MVRLVDTHHLQHALMHHRNTIMSLLLLPLVPSPLSTLFPAFNSRAWAS